MKKELTIRAREVKKGDTIIKVAKQSVSIPVLIVPAVHHPGFMSLGYGIFLGLDEYVEVERKIALPNGSTAERADRTYVKVNGEWIVSDNGQAARIDDLYALTHFDVSVPTNSDWDPADHPRAKVASAVPNSNRCRWMTGGGLDGTRCILSTDHDGLHMKDRA